MSVYNTQKIKILDLAHRERTAGIEASAKRYKAKALLS